MIDLERRAMLGDRQAQEECTRKGIMLACPFCGGKASVSCDPNGTVDAMERIWAYTVVCNRCCATSGLGFSQIMMIRKWNTRCVPPVGLSKDCKSWRGDQNDADAPCSDCDGIMEADNCCKNYEPREGRT